MRRRRRGGEGANERERERKSKKFGRGYLKGTDGGREQERDRRRECARVRAKEEERAIEGEGTRAKKSAKEKEREKTSVCMYLSRESYTGTHANMRVGVCTRGGAMRAHALIRTHERVNERTDVSVSENANTRARTCVGGSTRMPGR